MSTAYKLLALGAAAALLLAALFWAAGPRAPGHAVPGLAQAPQGGDFVLDSADGPVGLLTYRGRVVLLYFGYTLCPDVCPTNLAAIARALDLLGADEAREVQVIFISVDPERDTPERLKTYTAYFHPGMIGVTGPPATLAEVAARYGVSYRKTQSDSALGYLVDHSASTYLIDRAGRLRGSLGHASAPGQIAEAIKNLLAER